MLEAIGDAAEHLQQLEQQWRRNLVWQEKHEQTWPIEIRIQDQENMQKQAEEKSQQRSQTTERQQGNLFVITGFLENGACIFDQEPPRYHKMFKDSVQEPVFFGVRST